MIKKRWMNNRGIFLFLLRQKQLEGFQVTESIAYANRNTGFVNKNFCQGESRTGMIIDG